MELDWNDEGDLNGFFVTNDDGTCLYDDFYSTTSSNEEGFDTMTGPQGMTWVMVEDQPYESNVWDGAGFVNFLVNSEVDGYGAIYTFDGMSWYLWDQSGSVCNMELDFNDEGTDIYGFFVTNDDGTCLYDDFYSTFTDNGFVGTITGPLGMSWYMVEDQPNDDD